MTNILAFSGSTREQSFNKKLLQIAVDAAQAVGANVTTIDLRDYALPLYDGDIEAKGFPDNAKKLKAIFSNQSGLLIASPEYNGGYSAVLKNAIDWVSRPMHKDEPMLAQLAGKPAAIMAASAGGLGGIRGLFQLRELLFNIQVTVLPNMGMVSHCFDAFDTAGALKDNKKQRHIEAIATQLVSAIRM